MIPLAGQPIVTADAMRAAEAASGAATAALMQRAGAELARAIARLAGTNEVLVLCGPGNNGGDGYVAATRLAADGHKVRVAANAPPVGAVAQAARAGWAGAVEPIDTAGAAPVVVDALFGTGLSRPLADGQVGALRRLLGAAHLRIAVDLPSGVATDDGAMLSAHPGVDVTLALGATKPAHMLYPAAALCGAVRVLDIGVAVAGDVMVSPRPALGAPAADAHKYTRGMVAIVAGAMPGAAALAAMAASHVAGYVLLLGSATDRLPHAIVRRRWAAGALDDQRIGAVVIGPGLGRREEASARLTAALASERPLVIDGDALHLLDVARPAERPTATILTPHEGEFAAAFGAGEGSKIDRARAAARRSGAIVVVKGADTVIAAPDGRVRVAEAAPSWLATAGSGDVLAGIVGALLATGHEAFDAASHGVWLHAEAARIAGTAFVADGLAAALPRAIAAAA
jgi:hydroxyethylthiazole kinase-like uncharacterized protein yjeF